MASKEVLMRIIRGVHVYATDLTEGQHMQGRATVFAPRTLVPQADKQLQFDGALIDHCDRHPIRSGWAPKMDDDEWEQFLLSQFSLDDQDIGVHQASTRNTRYTLIVLISTQGGES